MVETGRKLLVDIALINYSLLDFAFHLEGLQDASRLRYIRLKNKSSTHTQATPSLSDMASGVFRAVLRPLHTRGLACTCGKPGRCALITSAELERLMGLVQLDLSSGVLKFNDGVERPFDMQRDAAALKKEILKYWNASKTEGC